MGSQSLRPRKTPSRWFRGPIAPVDPREDEDAGFVLSMHGKPKRHFLIGKGAMLPIPPELKSARPLQMHRLASTVDKYETLQSTSYQTVSFAVLEVELRFEMEST